MSPEPEDWPVWSDDRTHRFGPIPSGARVCAYCASANLNSAAPWTVQNPDHPGTMSIIVAGAHFALLAAAVNGYRIIDACGYSGQCVVPITTVNGTEVCSAHFHLVRPQ